MNQCPQLLNHHIRLLHSDDCLHQASVSIVSQERWSHNLVFSTDIVVLWWINVECGELNLRTELLGYS